jgi:NAD(P)-dependent dehydrogenase (short-subunit alcohol dehydrogenase family)
MTITLKPLTQQVVVVLGASSGIGRATALRLAARGARLVVAARSQTGLQTLVDEIVAEGGTATSVVCDVSDPVQVQQVADAAVSAYGGVDTWVNCAAQSLYATFWDTSPEEFRRLMEVNYLGQVHGALAAIPLLRRAGRGALISVSSVEAITALPLHAAYSAGKHAAEGAMEALRRDLMSQDVPISVTSVKPGTINTPLFTNSRNTMDHKPKGPPPLYSPSAVAACVEYAAEHPVRDLFAGGGGKQMAVTQFLAPRLMDRLMAKVLIRTLAAREPVPGGSRGNLDAPSGDDRVDGDFHGRPSLYSWWQVHPGIRRTALAALATAAVVTSRRPAGRRS